MLAYGLAGLSSNHPRAAFLLAVTILPIGVLAVLYGVLSGLRRKAKERRARGNEVEPKC